MVPDDTQSPPDGPQPEEGSAAAAEAAPAALADPAAVQARVAMLEAQLEESIRRARETNDRLKDTHERLLRTAAEFDNFKKRTQKEKEDVRKFGNESLLKDFLPVMDNLERALDHADQHEPKKVIDGVRLVQKLFESTLAKHGVQGFSARGSSFDPTLHEALMQQESDESPGTVVGEMARGYRLNDRLIRPAAVVVAKTRTPAAGQTPQPASGTADGTGEPPV